HVVTHLEADGHGLGRARLHSGAGDATDECAGLGEHYPGPFHRQLVRRPLSAQDEELVRELPLVLDYERHIARLDARAGERDMELDFGGHDLSAAVLRSQARADKQSKSRHANQHKRQLLHHFAPSSGQRPTASTMAEAALATLPNWLCLPASSVQ